jgi:hypothetical protein
VKKTDFDIDKWALFYYDWLLNFREVENWKIFQSVLNAQKECFFRFQITVVRGRKSVIRPGFAPIPIADII